MSAEDSNGWQLMESDPSVFSELLKTLQVPLIMDDLPTLDPAGFAIFEPLHAMIFLFKWMPSTGSTSAGTADPDFPGFFAHQVVNNACATLAVVNALGNIPALTCGKPLQELLGFAQELDPQTRGIVISSADWLREAHNSLTPPNSISLEGLGLPKKSEEAYHFVVYLPVAGSVYELDGLKEHPVNHGVFQESSGGWTAKASEIIQNRISTYPEGALDFTLLALHNDPLPELEKELTRCQASNNHAEAAEIVVKIDMENVKRAGWAFENSLRRHNHLGFAHALLSALASANLLEAAKEKAITRAKRERERSSKAPRSVESIEED
ncbi:hypothetical protein C8J56DRAFT_927375 [Mycena floridula]|nr:hypothetical protein C8J56DRAFT_927375 [Mycena floridula]